MHATSLESPSRSHRDQRRSSLLSSISLATLGRIVIGLLTFVAAGFNTVDINFEGLIPEESVGLDWVVGVKLILAAACGATGLVGVYCNPSWLGVMWRFPGCLLVSLGGVFLVTSVFAIPQQARVCQAAALVLVCYLAFLPTAIQCLGLRRMADWMLLGMVVNLLANWWFYLAVPSIGVYEEELSGDVRFLRMGGLGHPNAIGRMAILAGLIAMWRQFWPSDSSAGSSSKANLPSKETFGPTFAAVLHFAIMGLAVATLAAAFSRTSVLAGTLGAAALWGSRLWTPRGLGLLLGGGGLTLVLAIAISLALGNDLGDYLVRSLTKTGDVGELTTATGRTAIWGEAIRLIGQRPITGYGLNSAPVMLEDFSYHTHNLLLHAAFSGGLVAGLLVAMLVVWNLALAIGSSSPLVRAVSTVVLISGMFEDTVLDTFPGPSTLLWMAVLVVASVPSPKRSIIKV